MISLDQAKWHAEERQDKEDEPSQSAGLVVSGTSPDERLVEVIELKDHPFFVASQFHPEFKSRPERPAPLFREFVTAALDRAAARDGAVDPSQGVRASQGTEISPSGVATTSAGRS